MPVTRYDPRLAGERSGVLQGHSRAVKRKGRIMRQLVNVRRFMQPLMAVVGILTGAGAAKSGYGAWVAGGVASLFSIYFGTMVTLMATRTLAALVARLRRCELAEC